jgi:TolB-like protein
LAAALAALLIVVAGGAWWFLNANRPAPVAVNAPPPLAAQRLSIVVLPFANLSGDPGQDYLVDALTDELTTSLARLRYTFVIAHNTAMTLKGKPVDAKAIGKELGVRCVLEGSVQPSGDQMRVNAQLIDAGSGAHVWAEQFDTPRADLLQMQDTILTHLAHAMDVQLVWAEGARAKRTQAANPDAEDLSLQCGAGLRKGGKEADAAYALCEQALAIDPNNVPALMLSGVKFWVSHILGVSGDPQGDLDRADELESKAIALDPDWTWPHTFKGGILRAKGRPEEAVAEHERALALDPSNVSAAAQLGIDTLYLGQFDKSLEYLDRAIRLSPYDPDLVWWYENKAWANFGLKNYDQAIECARRSESRRCLGGRQEGRGLCSSRHPRSGALPQGRAGLIGELLLHPERVLTHPIGPVGASDRHALADLRLLLDAAIHTLGAYDLKAGAAPRLPFDSGAVELLDRNLARVTPDQFPAVRLVGRFFQQDRPRRVPSRPVSMNRLF